MTNWHRLHVPQCERGLAKALGARWCWEQKAWLCSKGRFHTRQFERWHSQATWKSYVLFVSFAEREQAKRWGARYSPSDKKWHYDSSVDTDQLPSWVREHLKPPAKQVLRVPFAEKHLDKQAGAQWDADRRAWTMPIGVKLPEALAQYAVAEPAAASPAGSGCSGGAEAAEAAAGGGGMPPPPPPPPPPATRMQPPSWRAGLQGLPWR
jgi:hypothetical protein